MQLYIHLSYIRLQNRLSLKTVYTTVYTLYIHRKKDCISTVYTAYIQSLYIQCIYSDCIYRNIMMLKSTPLYTDCTVYLLYCIKFIQLYIQLYIQCVTVYTMYIQSVYSHCIYSCIKFFTVYTLYIHCI